MYINEKVFGLPSPSKPGFRNRYKKKYSPYVHKVSINNYIYFKVHLKRGDKSKIKYFKTMREANIFVELLNLNPYL